MPIDNLMEDAATAEIGRTQLWQWVKQTASLDDGRKITQEWLNGLFEAGAAGVHFEDQLASAKKCGHMGCKVLVPTSEPVAKLSAARLAADIMATPTILVARTDAMAAALLTSDVDAYDHEFITGERTVEGFYETRAPCLKY